MAISWRVPALIVLGVVVVVIRPSVDIAVGWMLLVLALLAADWLVAFSPRRLRISRLPVPPVRAFETTTSTLIVQPPTRSETPSSPAGKSSPNPPRLPWRLRVGRVQVRDAWPPSAGPSLISPEDADPAGTRQPQFGHTIQVLRPGDRDAQGRWLTHTYLTPQRRGVLRADHITVRIWGPLRLAARQVSMATDTKARALPAFPSRKQLPRALSKLQLIEGSALANRRGQGTEFDSLREWVDGDDVRSIDWRATARTDDTVVVRTWRPQRDRHVLIVLDTSRLSAIRLGDVSRLDAQMDAALLLSALCAKAGDSVSLMAADSITHVNLVKPARNHVLQALSSSLTTLESALIEADWRRIVTELSPQLRSASLVVLLTAVEHTSLAESLLPALIHLAKKTRVVIASVSDVEPSREDAHAAYSDLSEVYRDGAFNYVKQRRERDIEAISKLGVNVIEGDPQRLPAALVDYYLELKAAGKL